MSRSAEDAGPGAGRRPLRRRGVWAGLVIGVVAVSGALAAVVYAGGDDDSAEGREASARPDEPVEASHEWPADYTGQVWITVTAPDDAPRSVTIRWGPWERRIVHDSAEPVTYWFTKAPPEPGDVNVPTTVRVDPGAQVAFDLGAPPVGAVDASTDWDPAADAGDDTGA